MKDEITTILEKTDLSSYGVTDSGITIKTDKLKEFIDDDIIEMVGGELYNFEVTQVAFMAQVVRILSK